MKHYISHAEKDSNKKFHTFEIMPLKSTCEVPHRTEKVSHLYLRLKVVGST